MRFTTSEFFEKMEAELEVLDQQMTHSTNEAFFNDLDEEHRREIEDCYYSYKTLEEFYYKLGNRYFFPFEMAAAGDMIDSARVDDLIKKYKIETLEDVVFYYSEVWDDLVAEMEETLAILDELISEKEQEEQED